MDRIDNMVPDALGGKKSKIKVFLSFVVRLNCWNGINNIVTLEFGLEILMSPELKRVR